ncbi:MAG: ABC transporter substrate-binding protein [Spirochaetota bacterium]
MFEKKRSALIVALMLCLAATSFANGAAEEEQRATQLKYVYWGSTAEDEAIKNALSGFESANPGISVEPMYLPGDLDGSTYNARMTTMAASGTLPDLGYFRPEEFGNYATNGYFMDLTDLVERDGMDEAYLPQTWLSIDGSIYGAYTAAECQVMWYNPAVLEQAGVPVPPTDYRDAWTWDEFVGYLRQITVDANGNHPGDAGFSANNIETYGVAYDLWVAMYYPTIWSSGGDVFNADGTDTLIDSPESIEAIQRLADLIHEEQVMPYMGGGSGLPSPTVMLQNEQLGFYVTGQWTLLELGGMDDLDLGVAALPIQETPAQLYVSGINVVFEASENPEDAWSLQKWMMDPSKTLDLYTSGLWMPTKQSYYTDPADLARWIDNPVHPEGYREAIVDSMEIARTEPIMVRNYNQIWGDHLTPAMESIWIGQDSAQEALTAAAEALRESGLLEGMY